MVLSFFNYKLFEESGLLGHTKTNIPFSPAVSCYSQPLKCTTFPRGLIRLNSVCSLRKVFVFSPAGLPFPCGLLLFPLFLMRIISRIKK